MEAFLVSTGVVALVEIGDKTQLLAFVLVTRFKRPLPIIAGILAATLVNHAMAGALGAWLLSLVDPALLRRVLGLAFLALAAKYTLPVAVVAGTTLGMMIANVPAVLIGDRLLKRVPMKVVQRIAAALFVLLGLATIFGADLGFSG